MSESQRNAELEKAPQNGRVGHVLVSETDAVRVWMISLQPGERIAYHCHVLNYFWTATAAGTSKSRYGDGRVAETTYKIGDTRHYTFGKGESMIHDLENISQTPLGFVTVELKIGSANQPLPLG
ncbi:MAG: hypothetical protein WCB71_07050 [Aestuariivirga sp.]